MKFILSIEDTNRIKAYLNSDNSWYADLDRFEKKNLSRKANNFVIFEDKLYLKENELLKEVIANDDTFRLNQLFEKMHLPDHTGMKAMYEKSKQLYARLKREKLNSYVNSCLICKRHVPLARISQITPIISTHPWDIVQTDCVDMRNYSHMNDGYGWILNIIDSYFKFLFSFPLKNKTAENVKLALEQILYSEGAPKVIQTDNGKEFINSPHKTLLQEWSIKFVHSRPRYPQNQGQVERANQTITRKLAKALSNNTEKNWVSIHRNIIFKYNTTWHRAIGTTPMKAFRNRIGENTSLNAQAASNENEVEEIDSDTELKVDLKVIQIQSENSEHEEKIVPIREQHSVKEEYRHKYIRKMVDDADFHYNRINFNPGDLVLIKKSFDNNPNTKKNKMDQFYEEGVWVILERIGGDSYKVKRQDNNDVTVKTVSKNTLKKCFSDSSN